jgi:hypothetical protein
MNEAELDALEREFNLVLPCSFRRFMASYPRVLETTAMIFGDHREPLSERYFVNDATRLRALNHLVRLPDTPWLEDGSSWPAVLFVIGDDQCGNYYAIDTASEGGAVLFYDHDPGVIEVHSKSLAAFVDSLVADATAFNTASRQQ